MTETRTASIAALVMCLSTIGLVSAAARQGRDSSPAQAAAPVGGGRGAAAPVFSSPEVMTDKRVVFRIFAPKADEVRLAGTDIPQNREGMVMTKAGNGVWEITVGPLPPGSYRYNFNVGGVSVIDPRSPAISGSNNNVWSLVHVPGAAFMDTSDVPHGAVAAVTYYSTALRKVRQMHVYTPPGYELGGGKFPVFYLLRRRRRRRRLDFGRPRGIHPGQPDRGEEGDADDRRDAGRPHDPDDGRASSGGGR
jgi:enterochelin esterase family protein